MEIEQIKFDDWLSFVDSFSKLHKKKLFNLEELESSGEKKIIAENLKLKEITINIEEGENNNTTMITGDAPDKELNHFVLKTNNISLRKSDSNGEDVLYIGSEVGNTIVLNFREVSQ